MTVLLIADNMLREDHLPTHTHLDYLQRHVHGYVTAIELPHNLVMWVADDFIGHPPNPLATAIIYLLTGEVILLQGDAVITSSDGENTTGMDVDQLTRVKETARIIASTPALLTRISSAIDHAASW